MAQYSVTNAGTQVVKAPNQKAAPKGKSKIKTGNDLRTGKK